MQPFAGESRPIYIWEQMRKIEEELFLLSERTGELDVEDRRRIGRLRGERTHLASQLLLIELAYCAGPRHLPNINKNSTQA